MKAHPIEIESYRIINKLLENDEQFSKYDYKEQTIIKRVIHATGNLDLTHDFDFSPNVIEKAIELLNDGCPILTDVKMTSVGINYSHKFCFLDDVNLKQNSTESPTRSALGIRHGLSRFKDNLIVVVGCAPTAIDELLGNEDYANSKDIATIGVPVGFVGAVDQKQKLKNSTKATITNRSILGGSAMAAAITNALIRLAAT